MHGYVANFHFDGCYIHVHKIHMVEIELLHHPEPLVCIMYTLCMYHCTFFMLQKLDECLTAEDETKEDVKVHTTIACV